MMTPPHSLAHSLTHSLAHSLTHSTARQPIDLGGQRALDFVLDNPTLNDLNRTLLIDVKLLAVY
jgi:hypothetical protein